MHRTLRSLAIAAVLTSAGAAAVTVAPHVTPSASADDAGSAAALYKQGLAYKAQGKLDEALVAFEKSVAIEPRNGMAWASIGHLYKKKNDQAKSLAAYEEAVKYAPAKTDAVVWGNLGMAYYRAARVDDAQAALEQSIKLDGKAADVHSNLGVILRKKGDAAGAMRELEQAVKLAPKDAAYQNNYGVALRAANKLPEAATAFQAAIALAPGEADYHFNLGVVYRRQQEVELAIASYTKAVELKPTMAEAWFDLGHMYKLDHENEKATEAFNKYLALNQGKDPVAQAEIEAEVKALGADPAPVTATPSTPPPADPPKTTPKKKPVKKKKVVKKPA